MSGDTAIQVIKDKMPNGQTRVAVRGKYGGQWHEYSALITDTRTEEDIIISAKQYHEATSAKIKENAKRRLLQKEKDDELIEARSRNRPKMPTTRDFKI